MKKYLNLLYFFFLFFILLVSDILFSNYIAHKVIHGSFFSNHFLKIIYAENSGAAFSILQNSTVLLICLSLIALLIIFYFVFRNLEKIKITGLIFIAFFAAGIFGNLYDRITLGYVRDFFDLTFINFPIFNISDVLINIGIFGIIVLILLNKKSHNII